ncbi:MAG TPA: amidohydrolase family protein [Streptosporangiaceae bacterium]|nr:amidohydrolase family protein [Streptosporangiaceae bacterium]
MAAASGMPGPASHDDNESNGGAVRRRRAPGLQQEWIDAGSDSMTGHVLALEGGRVIDPLSGLEDVRTVIVADGRISEVSPAARAGTSERVDVSGLVIAPGYIDLHSHGQTIASHRLQALDGVTTALDLEAGRSPVTAAYQSAGAQGRPLNYGFSASWALARMHVVAGIPADGSLGTFLANIGVAAWQQPAEARQLRSIRGRLEADLAAGALGIGVLVGYAQGVDPREYTELARLAAATGTSTFTHARDLREDTPDVRIDGATEVIQAAAETGARAHYCHINSTSRRHIERVHAQVRHAVAAGAQVSTEAYPYGSGMTGIGAAFLDPEWLPRWGLTPSSIVYAPAGERVSGPERLAELRRTDPAGLAIVDFLDEASPSDAGFLLQALTFPDTIIASDAMPITWPGQAPDGTAWPLPPGGITHPRTAGTYAKAFRLLVRQTGQLGLPEFIRRASTLPAQLLAGFAPAMRGKGRIQRGADADLVVFDPATVADQATYAESTRPSTGVRHLLVGGHFVVRDGEIVSDSLPGRPVLGATR